LLPGIIITVLPTT